MNTYNTGKDLFIVDNSVSGWTGLRYLEEWTDIAKSLDVATGYFEVGALLALAGKWNKLEKIRILMGDETTFRTRKLIYDAVKKSSQSLTRTSRNLNLKILFSTESVRSSPPSRAVRSSAGCTTPESFMRRRISLTPRWPSLDLRRSSAQVTSPNPA